MNARSFSKQTSISRSSAKFTIYSMTWRNNITQWKEYMNKPIDWLIFLWLRRKDGKTSKWTKNVPFQSEATTPSWKSNQVVLLICHWYMHLSSLSLSNTILPASLSVKKHSTWRNPLGWKKLVSWDWAFQSLSLKTVLLLSEVLAFSLGRNHTKLLFMLKGSHKIRNIFLESD